MLGAIILGILLIGLGIWTIYILAWCNLFLKAGEKGWKALIHPPILARVASLRQTMWRTSIAKE